MRRPLLSSMLVLAVLVPAGAQAQASEDRAAVQAVITAFADGIHTGALANVEGLFAPSGVHILVDNAALHGWGEYRDEHLQPEMARYSDVRYAHTGIESSVRGNIAWTAFRWQMSSAGDGPAPVLGRGSAVLEKIDGTWRIAHLHISR
jgi:ketosteroid isomerase-like protein